MGFARAAVLKDRRGMWEMQGDNGCFFRILRKSVKCEGFWMLRMLWAPGPSKSDMEPGSDEL